MGRLLIMVGEGGGWGGGERCWRRPSPRSVMSVWFHYLEHGATSFKFRTVIQCCPGWGGGAANYLLQNCTRYVCFAHRSLTSTGPERRKQIVALATYDSAPL